MGLQSRDFQPEEIVSREALATEVQLPCVQSQPLLRSPQPSVDAEMPQAPAELANGTNGQRQQAPTEIHGSTSGQQQQAPIQSRDMSDTEMPLHMPSAMPLHMPSAMPLHMPSAMLLHMPSAMPLNMPLSVSMCACLCVHRSCGIVHDALLRWRRREISG